MWRCADAGATLIDTADVYAPGPDAIGANERLVAAALASLGAGRSRIVVATKGGLTRPQGRWLADGRARHLAAACEASLARLGGEAIDLYQLHAPDPRVPIRTSARALAGLRDRGLVRAIGLSNVSLAQLLEAAQVARIDAVQVSLGPWDDESLRNGLVEHCLAEGIRVLAHSPLGGPRGAARLERDRTVHELAARLDVTPAVLALAWILDLDPRIVPLAGATRPESARDLARALSLELDRGTRAALDERFPGALLLRRPRSARRPIQAAGDVVIVMGSPAAGKSSLARGLVERGHARLNRDERGGTLRHLLPELERLLAAGRRQVVLDNTYATRSSRNHVIELAWKHGAPVRCLWLKTSLADAQVNAALRMLERHGRLLDPAEIKQTARRDPQTFGPNVLFRYQRELEPPSLEEGFETVEQVEFARRSDASRGARGVLVALDAAMERPDGSSAWLAARTSEGCLLLAQAWRPRAADAGAARRQALERLGIDLEVALCPHPNGPPRCWCRPPLPGLAVAFMERHRLAPERSLLLGHGNGDRRLAEALGLGFVELEALAR